MGDANYLTKRPDHLAGERGLLAAVMAQAVKDLDSSSPVDRLTAAGYFCSPAYKHHCELLGLPPGAMPAQVEEGR